MDLSVHSIHHQKPICQIQHCLYGICKSLLDPRLHDKTIHHDLNIVLDILIQADFLGKFIHIPVDLHTYIPASSGMFQQPGMSPFTSPHYRRQQLQPGTLRKSHDRIHHLVYRLLPDLPAAFRTMRDSHPGI